MDDRGNIQYFASDFEAKKAGFNIPLSEAEAAELAAMPPHERLELITQRRSEELWDRKQAAMRGSVALSSIAAVSGGFFPSAR